MIALTILQLLKEGAKIEQGSVLFEGQDLLTASEEELCHVRGNEISMIFQEPMTSLNPLMTIYEQVAEPLLVHESFPEDVVRERVEKVLTDVGLNDVINLMQKYPHELSGGMRQRVMIAQAIITRPKLLIADEPTTALDVLIQDQILTLLKKINQKYGLSVLLISHDLNVIRKICDTVGVLYQGRMLEEGTVSDVFEHPKEEYTKTLVAHLPCAAHLPEEKVLLKVEHLTAYYEEKKHLLGKKVKVDVLRDLSFEVHEGEILGVVGESGSGKSSLARVLTGLNPLYEGAFEFSDPSIRPQMVFQDPFGSLNPVHSVGWMMTEALYHRKDLSKREKKERVLKMLEAVGLTQDYYDRQPSELSGGQRQRISIGTALLYGSPFLIADEAVSALDVTVQSQILELLLKLQKEKNLTILFITHDMAIVKKLCHRVIVLYNGEIVEAGNAKEVCTHPSHEYTKRLMEASLLE